MSEQQNTSAVDSGVLVNEETATQAAVEKQPNSVVRFLFEDHGVRGDMLHMHEAVQPILEHMKPYPKAIKQLMLELASASVLIAATLKANGTVTVQIQGGKGPHALRFAFINIDKNLNFYGNASWPEYDDKLDAGDEESKAQAAAAVAKADANNLTFQDLVGRDGILVISAFPEDGVRYQGIVALDKPSLSEALETYFKDSEQLATTMLLHHDLEREESGGIMLQIIPNIENNLESLEHLTTLSATLSADELFSLTLHESLRRLFWNDKVRVFTPEQVQFKCVCSKERILNAVRGLPISDLEDIIKDPNGITMTCHSCGKVYKVTPDEIAIILAAAKDAKAQEQAQAKGQD